MLYIIYYSIIYNKSVGIRHSTDVGVMKVGNIVPSLS